MGNRRKSRELAMQALFYMDMHQNDSEERLELFCKYYPPSDKVLPFFLKLVRGVMHAKPEIDSIIERFSEALYINLGIFLPLITVNCAILGVSLFMVIRKYTFIQSVLFGAGSGLGWLLAILAMAGIRQRLNEKKIPPALRGPGIVLIITGLMAMAFIGFSGIVQIQ